MVIEKERLSMYIQWIAEAIQKIEFHIKSINITQLEKYPTVCDACLMQLMHIWETANKIHKKFPKFDTLPIKQMIGLRNFVAHDYLWTNITIVKNIIQKNLPEIKKTIIEYKKNLA